MAVWISIVIFISTFIFCLTAYRYITHDQQIVQARLEQFINTSAVSNELVKDTSYPQITRNVTWRSIIRTLSKVFESQQLSRFMEHKLIQAGWPIKGSEFLVVCVGAALVVALVVLIFTAKLVLALLGASLGCLLPALILQVKIAKRVRLFNEQLGDCLVLIANSLRTGYSFMQAVEMVSSQMPQPISVEFGRALREMNLGITTEDALNNLAKRINSDDLDLVITAVLIQRQVGGNLAEVLDSIAETIRERVKIKGEIKTMTAQGRISGLIIGIMPIGLGLMIYVINPEYINILFSTTPGKMMLVGAAVSEVMGILFIHKIVNIEV